jgi:orotidine-5'-phosphate decarboxylase
MHFLEKLDAITVKNKSLVCVGLDVDPKKLPLSLLAAPDPILNFNRAVIEATADLAICYKLNIAFYEGMGRAGYDVIRGTLNAIPGDILTIGDAKRADIGNTTEHYARALFDDFGFDSITTAPYMGFDSVEPFLKHKDKGVFVLALTSNPGSRDFQYLKVDGRELYKHVIDRVLEWNTAENCGLVVGATHPGELGEIRAIVGSMPILVPGLGAQGGDMKQSVKLGVDAGNRRVLFNSSRAILYASSGEDYKQAAAKAALEMRDAINTILSE